MILFGLGLTLMVAGPGLLMLVWVLRSGTRWALLAAAATIAGCVWWIELYRAATSAGDLGGMFDCYPDCSTSQEAAWAILGYLPIAMGALLVALFVAAGIRYMRSRSLNPARARATR